MPSPPGPVAWPRPLALATQPLHIIKDRPTRRPVDIDKHHRLVPNNLPTMRHVRRRVPHVARPNLPHFLPNREPQPPLQQHAELLVLSACVSWNTSALQAHTAPKRAACALRSPRTLVWIWRLASKHCRPRRLRARERSSLPSWLHAAHLPSIGYTRADPPARRTTAPEGEQLDARMPPRRPLGRRAGKWGSHVHATSPGARRTPANGLCSLTHDRPARTPSACHP